MAFPGFSFGGIKAALSSAYQYTVNILFGAGGQHKPDVPAESIAKKYPELTPSQINQVQITARDANIAGRILTQKGGNVPVMREVIPRDPNIIDTAAYKYTGTVGMKDPNTGEEYYRDVTVLTPRNLGRETVTSMMAIQARYALNQSPKKGITPPPLPGTELETISVNILSVFRRT